MAKTIDKETGIWSLRLAKKRHKCDLTLTDMIITLFNPEKAIDLGCGNGQYCSILESHGWSIIGYEGTKDVKSLGFFDKIEEVDLSKPLLPSILYDFVLCLEVGEHIPPKHEEVFIDNVCGMASKYLLFSWAVEGQRGTGHINNHSNEYIINEISKRGLYYKKKLTRLLRKSASFKYFKNTVMVFEYG